MPNKHFYFNTPLTVIEKDATVTEIIEPSGRVTSHELEALNKKVAEHLDAVSAIIVTGSFPPGVPDHFFNFIKNEGNKIPLYVDGVNKSMEALSSEVTILKINSDELLDLTGTENGVEGWVRLNAQYCIQTLIITKGSAPTLLVNASAGVQV